MARPRGMAGPARRPDVFKTETCPVCFQLFVYDTTDAPFQRYCSMEHRRQAAHKKRLRKGEDRSCPKCGLLKPRSEFSGGTHAYCRSCHAQYMRERRSKKPEAVVRYRRTAALRRHGLTREGFDALLADQGGRCAICRTDDPGGHGWHVDHDHACCTGRKNQCGECVRGLLCNRCNIGLGNLRDDPAVLRAAVAYIEQYKSRRRQ